MADKEKREIKKVDRDEPQSISDLKGKLTSGVRLRNTQGAELVVLGLHYRAGSISNPLGTIYEVEHPADELFPPITRLATREGLEQAGYDVPDEGGA